MYVCVYIYIYTHIFIYTYIHTYIYTYGLLRVEEEAAVVLPLQRLEALDDLGGAAEDHDVEGVEEHHELLLGGTPCLTLLV